MPFELVAAEVVELTGLSAGNPQVGCLYAPDGGVVDVLGGAGVFAGWAHI